MNLATRCPNCATVFRVQPGQLSARGGRVRCGRCHLVFDGVAALLEEGAAVAPSAPPEPSPQLALFESARRVPPPAAARAEPASEEAPAADFLAEEPPRRRHRLAWSLGSFAALVVLAAQAALYFRTEIAVLVPEARPALAEGCALLGCELRLPRRPELMAIDSSDLQADNRRESVIVLNAVIRNRAPFAQEYPSLELTLTDERDQAVLRRVLAPAEYLQGAGAGRLAQGVAGGTEAALRVHLDTAGTRAVGYRLYLFYP